MKLSVSFLLGLLCFVAQSQAFAAPKVGAGKLEVKGTGFLQLILPSGTLVYTRSSQIRVNSNGLIVGSLRYPLTPSISVPLDTTRVHIRPYGVVSIRQPGFSSAVLVGQLEPVRFTHPEALRRLGNGLFQETTASGPPQSGVFRDRPFGYVLFRPSK